MKKYEYVINIILRLVIIIFVPLLLARLYVYDPLSFKFCFNSPSGVFLGTDNNTPITTIENNISEYLAKRGNSIQELSPIILINQDWLRYKIFLRNNLKVAIVVSQPKSYNEATTTFNIQTQYSNSTITYGQTQIIAEHLKSDNFNGLITGWNFHAQHNPIVVGTHEWISLQTSSSLGDICIGGYLETKYKWLIYIEFIIILLGFMVLLKEAIGFIKFGFRKYFIDDRDGSDRK